MKKVIGGSIAIILGLFCFSAFFSAFLTFLAGIIPLTLILAGCLTIYLNRDDDAPEYTQPEAKSIKAVEDKSVETKITQTQPEDNITDNVIEDTPKLSGNTSTYVFHSPDCKFSKSKKCTSFFNTREEAIQEGYKPCGICKP
ncbi:MAG: hypothetical protein DRH93_17980 [Deltaproteobacteria bacterium]|nr:MAG: hypothetical protein DRH93_17980 [Deltaproteobacteria bacterium]